MFHHQLPKHKVNLLVAFSVFILKITFTKEFFANYSNSPVNINAVFLLKKLRGIGEMFVHFIIITFIGSKEGQEIQKPSRQRRLPSQTLCRSRLLHNC